MNRQKSKHKDVKLAPSEVIKQPVLTEKALRLLNETKLKKYVFKVLPSANKNDIKEAVEKIFNVKVEKVNVINIPSRTKYYRYRFKYNRPSYKKAVVTLKEGYRIEAIDSSIEKEK
ncbi:MAG: 50S ribosomal protein L23 [Candidatus Calescibacterium sp.]|nr:50S ribosomal protein L23 [Candidatus Calescibacterium sp.]MCX7758346.1 50S ribosomal protein L23 [bacterium]